MAKLKHSFRVWGCGVALAWTAQPAWAEAVADGTSATPAAQGVPSTDAATESAAQASATPAGARRAADASVDRNILSPTAETLPEGDITFNSYELILAGLSYGVTDDLQLSLTTLLPIVEEIPLVLVGTGKLRLIEGPNDIFSIQPTFVYITAEGEGAGLFGLNAMYDHVFDDDGDVALTVGAGALGVLGSTTGGIDLSDGLVLTPSMGINGRVAGIVKLLAELQVPAAYFDGDFHFAQGVLFNYGVRFFSSSIAVDLTFLRPIGGDTGQLVMGVPFVTFAARF